MFNSRPAARLGQASLCALLAGAPAAAQCPANWTLASAGLPTVPGDPPIRQNSWGVFDAAHNLVVVFGGQASGTAVGDTWGWNGASWTQLAAGGPGSRSAHSMAYDSARARIVLFGGNLGGALSDTWEFDGATWTQVFPATSPPGRFNHAMAFDSTRNVVVLTGGFSTVRYSDTWEYDGVTWTQRLGTSYGGRNGHGMAFDASRNTMVIFGGFSTAGRLNDTREYDGASGNWTQILVTGPSGRQFCPLAYDTDKHVIMMFGGQTGPGTVVTDRQNDTWSYNGTAWTLLGSEGCTRRDQHVTVFDGARHALVVFGGYQGATFGGVAADTWTTSCPVTCYPNCDHSTVTPCLNVQDFGCFLNAFAAGDPYANCDNSTVVPVLNVQDFGCFLNAFANGCSSC